jgi:hypothetical protein
VKTSRLALFQILVAVAVLFAVAAPFAIADNGGLVGAAEISGVVGDSFGHNQSVAKQVRDLTKELKELGAEGYKNIDRLRSCVQELGRATARLARMTVSKTADVVRFDVVREKVVIVEGLMTVPATDTRLAVPITESGRKKTVAIRDALETLAVVTRVAKTMDQSGLFRVALESYGEAARDMHLNRTGRKLTLGKYLARNFGVPNGVLDLFCQTNPYAVMSLTHSQAMELFSSVLASGTEKDMTELLRGLRDAFVSDRLEEVRIGVKTTYRGETTTIMTRISTEAAESMIRLAEYMIYEYENMVQSAIKSGRQKPKTGLGRYTGNDLSLATLKNNQIALVEFLEAVAESKGAERVLLPGFREVLQLSIAARRNYESSEMPTRFAVHEANISKQYSLELIQSGFWKVEHGYQNEERRRQHTERHERLQREIIPRLRLIR